MNNNDDEKFCKCCGTKLIKTIYMQGPYVNQGKTDYYWDKKEFCGGSCARRYAAGNYDTWALDSFLRRRLIA